MSALNWRNPTAWRPGSPWRRTRIRVEHLEDRTAPTVVPIGGEFQVNRYTSGFQGFPSVAIDSSGDFVVAWDSQDGSGDGVYAQRYNSNGEPQGGEFRVNTFTTDTQDIPSVAMNGAGNFVVAWSCFLQDGSEDGVYSQRYDSAGMPLGSEFRVNTYTTNNQEYPSVAMNNAGDFVVAWASREQDGSYTGVYAQRYSSAGLPQGGEFRVNTYTTGFQTHPSVAMNQAGDFVVTWWTSNQDGSETAVYARRYNAAGMSQGDEFRVNTYTRFGQLFPSVAMDAAGNFIVAWESDQQDGSGYGIFGQRYDSAGFPVGGEFSVSTYVISNQSRPTVAMNQVGDFVVAWTSFLQDGSLAGIYAQAYLPDGTPDGGEFAVNTYTTGDQLAASVAMNEASEFAVVWESSNQAGPASSRDIYAQRFRLDVPRIRSTQINNGAGQRSRVTDLAVTFNQSVTFAGPVANAFTLTRNGGGAVSFTATANVIGGVTVVTLNNFTGLETESGSLRDGRYTLTALASQISAGGQQMAANYTFGDVQGLFRYYGDMNGDRRVDISDFGFFSLAYLQPPNYNAALDFNNDGRIDIADFGQFSVRFFTTLP